MKLSGIYKITNIVTNRIYVGASKDMKKRKHVHLYNLKMGKSYSKNMAQDYQDHGKDSFKFTVLELTAADDCGLMREREDHWLQIYAEDIKRSGYNIRLISTIRRPEEYWAKIAAAVEHNTPEWSYI